MRNSFSASYFIGVLEGLGCFQKTKKNKKYGKYVSPMFIVRTMDKDKRTLLRLVCEHLTMKIHIDYTEYKSGENHIFTVNHNQGLKKLVKYMQDNLVTSVKNQDVLEKYYKLRDD